MFWLGRSTTNYKESKSEKKDKITNNNDNSWIQFFVYLHAEFTTQWSITRSVRTQNKNKDKGKTSKQTN
jgi:hypothetical protein